LIRHSWNVSSLQAVRIQKKLASKVKSVWSGGPWRYVAGVDCAFSPDEKYSIAGVTVWDTKERMIVEQQVALRRLLFPYIPGFLSFREAPAILAALAKLIKKPDVVMCDGHGLAHPRRFGIACHVGVLTKIPSMGCAKSRLVGEFKIPGNKRGSGSKLMMKGEVLGSVLRTKTATNPVFISLGHKMDLQTAEKIGLDCAIGYRIPEPTRLSDRLVAREKRDRFG